MLFTGISKYLILVVCFRGDSCITSNMKHRPDEVYGRSRSLFIRRQTMHPLIVREPAKATQLEATRHASQTVSPKKYSDCSPIRKSNTSWQTKSDGGITLPKVNGTANPVNSFTKINNRQKHEKDAEDYLQERAQLRRTQRIEVENS